MDKASRARRSRGTLRTQRAFNQQSANATIDSFSRLRQRVMTLISDVSRKPALPSFKQGETLLRTRPEQHGSCAPLTSAAKETELLPYV